MFNLRLTRMPFVAAFVAAAALVGGCASGPDVRGDYDRSVDFGKYKTYNFLRPRAATQPSSSRSPSR